VAGEHQHDRDDAQDHASGDENLEPERDVDEERRQ
jgi:hypothetical protein